MIQKSDRVGTLRFSLSLSAFILLRDTGGGSGWAAEMALYVVVVVVVLLLLLMVVVLIWINRTLLTLSSL